MSIIWCSGLIGPWNSGVHGIGSILAFTGGQDGMDGCVGYFFTVARKTSIMPHLLFLSNPLHLSVSQADTPPSHIHPLSLLLSQIFYIDSLGQTVNCCRSNEFIHSFSVSLCNYLKPSATPEDDTVNFLVKHVCNALNSAVVP
jgi:hypothetical protein